MSTLKETLRADLTSAIRGRDQVRAATLRMTIAAIGNAEVAGPQARELTEDEVLQVITKEAKKRREAAEAFTGAGRGELAATELAELAVLEGYLPAQLSDPELDALAVEAVRESGASGMAQMGAVMKLLQPRVGGSAEGGRVAAAVRRALGT